MVAAAVFVLCRQSCTWRWFDEGNTTQLNTNWVYAAETLLHEVRWAWGVLGCEGGLRLFVCVQVA